MSVKLGRYKYIATQGPCPEGFHVPLRSEALLLRTILTNLGLANGTAQPEEQVIQLRGLLKIPFTGFLQKLTASGGRTSSGRDSWQSHMRTSSSYVNNNDNVVYAYTMCLWYGTASGGKRYDFTINNGSIGACVIRPFYNEKISPNGSWQTLYQGTGSAGIYWQKDLGLITISDGTDYVTIADKNLGATKVYNLGDTLSEENCGYYYQWGNNHEFPFDYTQINVTYDKVNVPTNYGPGNWYNSSIFYGPNGSTYQLSPFNTNLWGGVDGNVWKDVESIKEEWKPGSSTVAYFPLTSDFVDVVTGDGPTSSSGTIDFTTKDGVLCASCPSGSVERAYNNRNWSTGNNPLTWHMWCNKNSYSHEWQVMISTGYGATTRCKAMGFHNNQFWTGGWNNDTYHCDALIGQWALYTWTFDGSTTKAYVNGELKNSKAMTYSVDSNNYSALFSQVIQSCSGQAQSADGYYRDIVIEDRARTADEIADYYNKTKGTYTGEGGGNDEANGHSLDEHSMFPQGPAPDGYHVPTKDELSSLLSIGNTLGARGTGNPTRLNNFCTYLKIPKTGYCNRGSGTPSTGTSVYLKSSSYNNQGKTYALFIAKTNSGVVVGDISTSEGDVIRPFKDNPISPDNTWTTLFDGSSVATGAGIFHNAGLGLISLSSDGTTWVTIADKNLGATIVWNYGDTQSESNCGKYYQRGNNYGFPYTGATTVSSTQVDASGYGPGNYYSSSTYITTTGSVYSWDSSNNPNLRGGVSRAELKQYYSFNLLNEYIGEYHECEVNTMGPCPSGFHIPTRQEWHDLYDIGYALGLWDTTNYGRQLQLQFNIPVCGKLNNDGTYTSSPTDAVYWCADKQSSSYGRDIWLRTTTDAATIDDDTTMIRGGSIRPFRNMPLIPTTSDSNWSIPSGSNPANGGIYDNETEGVISISADGAHWITLADKNLGATTKWYLNSTMSEANCGKFYQWGNNHGFPFTGTTKTSSTAVDASDYGPFSEYYDDDTFITTSPWDTSDNRNLWGGVSGPTRNCDIGVIPEPLTFVYTGVDQEWEVPKTGKYLITCKGAGSNTSAGGKGSGVIELTKGTILTIVVGQRGNSQSSATYGFGGSSNYGSDRAGGGLSGVFLGAGTVQPTDSARALVIGGGAGGGCTSGGRNGGVGGGEEGGNGGGSNYGTAGGGGTQTGRNSGGNVGANQFNGGNGSGTYGWGGGGGWYGGNSSIGDGSRDDDKGAGGGSGYVIASAENRLLTAGGGAGVGESGTVYISWYDPEGPVIGTDYTMLSLGGEINRYSELTLDGSVNLDNASTYWNGNVTQTDKAGLYYKVFTNEIIGFSLEGQPTNNNYDLFCLQFGETGDRTGANINSFYNGFRLEGTSNYYNWSSTGAIVCGIISNGTDTEAWKEALNSSTARIYITGTKSQDTWTLNITTSSGQEWTKTITYGNAIYAFGCKTGRWFTGQAGQIYKVILTLKD